MSYIVFSDEFLANLRDQVDIVALIGESLALKKQGARYVACCPFHEERTPSFGVTPHKGYYCYGCHAHGDAIEWMRQCHGLSFSDAVKSLAQRCGIPLPEPAAEDGAQINPAEVAHRRKVALLRDTLDNARRIYVHGLKKNAVVRQYLADRGITTQSIESFEIGVAGKGILPLLKVDEITLIDSGLAAKDAKKGHLYDRFRYRVMLPIRNAEGGMIGFAGRVYGAHAATNNVKYLNGPETSLFHKSQELYGFHLARPNIRKDRLAVVVEGYFDVVILHQYGENRAVATMGTAITTEQMKRLLGSADTILFAFDGDQAGIKAAVRAAAVFMESMTDGKEARFLFLPPGEDPDSVMRREGLSLWQARIDCAQSLSEFLTVYVSKDLDLQSPENLVRAVDRCKKILKTITHAKFFCRALQLRFESVLKISLNDDDK